MNRVRDFLTRTGERFSGWGRSAVTVAQREAEWLWSRWRRSLQFRTTTVTILVTFIAVWGVGIFLSNQIANGMFQERLQQAQSNTSRAVNQVQRNFDAAQVTDKSSLLVIANSTLSALTDGEKDNALPYLMAPIEGQGNPLSVSSLASPGITLSTIPEQLRASVRADDSGAQFWQSISLPVGSQQNHPAIVMGSKARLSNTSYELYLIYDLNRTQDTLNVIQSILWISGAVLLLLIGGIIWYVTRQVVRPVSQASRVAQYLAAGQLQERMSVKGEDEVARLGESFNKMATTLQEQITQLADLSQMQQNFVSDVSHELRTPLTTVRMAAQVLHESRDDFDPVNRRSAELLYNQVERFQQLLDDLLEISRFDAGAAVLDVEPADLLTVVENVITATRPLTERIGSQIQVISALPGNSCVVEMDSRRIERIVRNLLVNALEHGEGEPVEISLAADDDVAALAVRDYGVGMDEAALARVFDRFWRADPARARTTGGSGLGLAIAMEDARLHLGRLEVWSQPGEGACFRLTLPRSRQSIVDHSPLSLPSKTAAAPAHSSEQVSL
ncbi:MtrAB system histidine kinase MtrB [Acaricomes phytoseiuli]|uniref:MtrAB system histidine kinase MtrB n=1 Tax=Acaricomes phytoseiuli TaxID=291968 RepID=UPI000373227A|nr:MtrAB system histidine kinase MtrB [Acaricomes phytoseiuli]MCW1249423.1 MtrAB system histidine kinase MtrB [Acaricomes phytoseiuli]